MQVTKQMISAVMAELGRKTKGVKKTLTAAQRRAAAQRLQAWRDTQTFKTPAARRKYLRDKQREHRARMKAAAATTVPTEPKS